MTTGVSPTRLCVFARAPVLGGVKRRLATELGDAVALAAHIQLTEDTLGRLAAAPGLETELWLAGEPDAQVRGWLDAWPLPLRRQAGADLGQRMANALASCHADGVHGVVVGSDCPPIDAAYVRQAAEALGEADVVLGPASDGGYGLVGTGLPRPEIFKDIPWGTDAVLQVTLERIGEAALSVRLLAPIWDVDTASDWNRYLRYRRG
mgnify:CR=1 FL=1